MADPFRLPAYPSVEFSVEANGRVVIRARAVFEVSMPVDGETGEADAADMSRLAEKALRLAAAAALPVVREDWGGLFRTGLALHDGHREGAVTCVNHMGRQIGVRWYGAPGTEWYDFEDALERLADGRWRPGA